MMEVKQVHGSHEHCGAFAEPGELRDGAEKATQVSADDYHGHPAYSEEVNVRILIWCLATIKDIKVKYGTYV